MIQIARDPIGAAAVGLALHCAVLFAGPAVAARVPDIYSASVPVSDATADATNAAFAEALRRVVVKATGHDAPAADAALLGRLGSPAALVQQFRRDGSGNLWAQFDPAAVRRGLDAAGQPAWGDDRPVTVIWLAYDTGGGERDVLGAAADGPVTGQLRRDLLAAAETRAVPVVLPLRDSQELSAVTYADLWGDFSEPVVKASQRYRADAVLVGRARLFPPGMTDVRWTLLLDNERLEWRGGVASGPEGLAERLAQRLAASASGGVQGLRLAVSGIHTLDQYGQLLGYLQGLEMIEAASVGYVSGDTMMFDLRLRGDRERLTRALAIRRIVEPETGAPAGVLPADVAPDLTYRFVAGL